MARCSGGACHETTAVSAALSKFYAADAAASYDATVASSSLVGGFVSTAPILTHIAAGHQAVTYTPDEISKITNWLSVETAERAGGGGSNEPPPVDPKALLRDWSGCMTQANFDAALMAQKWGVYATNTNQACINCHQTGLGILINSDPATMFNAMSQRTAFMLKFFSVNTQEKKIVINTGSFMSANILTNHPPFSLENPAMTALQTFYDTTLAKQTAGGCDPARLLD